MTRFARLACVSACVVLVAHGASPAPVRADEGAAAWKELVSTTESLGRAAADLDAIVTRLDALGTGARSGQVVAYAADGGATAMAERVDAAATRAWTALAAAGFPSQDYWNLAVVHVRAASGASGCVLAESGNAVLVRERTSARPASATAPPRRSDGAPPSWDWLAASDRLWAEREEAGPPPLEGTGPGTLAHAVAGSIVARLALPQDCPGWLVAGLTAWTAATAFPDGAKQRAHLCGGPSAITPALLTPAASPTPGQARVLGEVLAAVMAGASDGPARLETLAGAGAKASAALAAMTGKDPAVVLADAARGLSADKSPCDAAGTVPCPLCRGTRVVEVACEACSGLGGIACPSCGGYPRCPSFYCCDGIQIRKDGPHNCALCRASGWLACATCGDKVKFPCRVCGGSGRGPRACPHCTGRGRVACPLAGGLEARSADDPCSWCGPSGPRIACVECAGSGFLGCRKCRGSARLPCSECHGIGCKHCAEIGAEACDGSPVAKRPCEACGGKGVRAADPARCALCGGSGLAAGPAEAWARRVERRRGLSDADRKKVGAVLASAIRFMDLCQVRGGAYALREQRWAPNGVLGDSLPPTLFSNAFSLWALLVSHVDPAGEEPARALRVLRGQVREALASRESTADTGVQAVSLALRALLAAGAAPDDPEVTALLRALVAAQRPSGHWATDLGSKDAGDAFQSLFAVESLWLAQRRGAKVPSETWSRALAAGLKTPNVIAKSLQRRGFLPGSSVASGVALIVLAKDGSLGGRAVSTDEYRSIPQVAQGLAWLDRYFSEDEEPLVVAGVRARTGTDAGHAAWLYAIQRVGQLLSVREFGGKPWYARGCRRLVDLPSGDGGFEELGLGRMNGPVRTTGSVLLFLSRATPPLTGKDAEEADGVDTSVEDTAAGSR